MTRQDESERVCCYGDRAQLRKDQALARPGGKGVGRWEPTWRENGPVQTTGEEEGPVIQIWLCSSQELRDLVGEGNNQRISNKGGMQRHTFC